MKKYFLSTIGLLLFVYVSYGQDVIYVNNGQTINAKVYEITEDYIKYFKFEQQSGPLRNIKKSDVFMIKYEDGTEEIFKKPDESKQDTQMPTTNGKSGEDRAELLEESKTNVKANEKEIQIKSKEDEGSGYKWGISVGYVQNKFTKSVPKQVYSSLKGLEFKVSSAGNKYGFGSLFLRTAYAKGTPIEIGDVPDGTESEIGIIDYGLENTFLIADFLTFSFTFGGFSVEEKLIVSTSFASAKVNGVLLAIGAGVNVPFGDNVGIRGNINIYSRDSKKIENALNSWSYNISLYLKFK